MRSMRHVISVLVLYLLATCEAGPSGVPQASLSLGGGDASQCRTIMTEWDLDKTIDSSFDPSGDSVTFNVDVTKETSGDPNDPNPERITVSGWLSITNGGGADAPIGSIVVNLQTQGSGVTNTVCSAIANAACGSDGTRATVVKGVSSSTNANSVCISPVGNSNVCQFTEGACAGDLILWNAANNDLFSLLVDPVLKSKTTWVLYYSASFKNSGPGGLGIPTGRTIRAEVLVTFANAGARGGSGSSVAGPADIDGSGAVGDTGAVGAGICTQPGATITTSIDPTSSNYLRTVPFRKTFTLAAPETCYASVTLNDDPLTALTTDGGLTYGTPTTDIDALGSTVSSTTSFTVTVPDVSVTDDDCTGRLTNTATLTLPSSLTPVTIIAPGGLTQAVYCCPGDSQTVSRTAEFQASGCDGPPPPGPDRTVCTYTQGKLANKKSDEAFSTIPILFETIAASDHDGDNTFFTLGTYHVGTAAPYFIKIKSASALITFLDNKGGTPNTLDASLEDPASTHAGNLASQTATLAIMVAFGTTVSWNGATVQVSEIFFPADTSKADPTNSPLTPPGTVIYCPDTPNYLSGYSIEQIVQFANAVLSTAISLPVNGFATPSDVNQFIASINEGFDECVGLKSMPDFQMEACTNLLPGGSTVATLPVGLGAGIGGLFLLGGVGGVFYCRRRRRSVTKIAPAAKQEMEVSRSKLPDVVVIHSLTPSQAESVSV